MEVWKPIPGYEGYEVSNLGRVKSLKRKNPKILSQSFLGDYLRVITSMKNVPKDMLVHRLVALAFLPNPDNKVCVNHKDGCKTNNCVENLEWATTSENQLHSYRILKNPNGRSKLTKEMIETIKQKVSSGQTRASVAREYNVGKSCISRLIKGKTYQYM